MLPSFAPYLSVVKMLPSFAPYLLLLPHKRRILTCFAFLKMKHTCTDSLINILSRWMLVCTYVRTQPDFTTAIQSGNETTQKSNA